MNIYDQLDHSLDGCPQKNTYSHVTLTLCSFGTLI